MRQTIPDNGWPIVKKVSRGRVGTGDRAHSSRPGVASFLAWTARTKPMRENARFGVDLGRFRARTPLFWPVNGGFEAVSKARVSRAIERFQGRSARRHPKRRPRATEGPPRASVRRRNANASTRRRERARETAHFGSIRGRQDHSTHIRNIPQAIVSNSIIGITTRQVDSRAARSEGERPLAIGRTIETPGAISSEPRVAARA